MENKSLHTIKCMIIIKNSKSNELIHIIDMDNTKLKGANFKTSPAQRGGEYDLF